MTVLVFIAFNALLTWTPVAADGYRVYANGAERPVTPIVVGDGLMRGFVTNVTIGTRFAVSAFNAAGESPPSNTIVLAQACPTVNLGIQLPVSTGGATSGTSAFAGSCGGTGAPEMTFQWSAPATGKYTFDTFGSSYDTVLYVRNGSCTGAQLGCNDDSGGVQSQLANVPLLAGQTVVVFVDGFSTNAGGFALHIATTAATPTRTRTAVLTATSVPPTVTAPPTLSPAPPTFTSVPVLPTTTFTPIPATDTPAATQTETPSVTDTPRPTATLTVAPSATFTLTVPPTSTPSANPTNTIAVRSATPTATSGGGIPPGTRTPIKLGGLNPVGCSSYGAAALSGTHLAEASTTSGLVTFDVSNLAAPLYLGFAVPPFVGDKISMANEAIALVSGPAPDGTSHLWVFDLSTLSAPLLIGEMNTSVAVSSVTGIKKIAWAPTRQLAVFAMSSNGVWIADLSQPTNPRLVGMYDTPGFPQAVVLNADGTLVYVADGTQGLKVLDISDPAHPVLRGSAPMSGNQVDLGLSGSGITIVTAASTGALYTVDVSNPAAPVVRGSAALSTYGAAISVEGTVAAALSSDATSTFLDLYDVANPAAVQRRETGVVGPTSGAKSVTLHNGKIYGTAGDQGPVWIYGW